MDDTNSVSPVEIAFLERFLVDRESGRGLDLKDYQAQFPGHADLIAAAYERVTAIITPASENGTDERFAHFRLLRQLGRGGQGVVWLAADARLRRQVALKLLATSLLGIGKEEQAVIRARFEREAAVAARLDDPGLCKVYEVGEHAGVPWISMQYVEGDSLDRMFAAADGVSTSAADHVRRVVATVEAAARAVHEAHEAGLVHRDLKPGNIMVTPRDRVIVLDFGIAYDVAADGTLTATGQSLGSPAYMAPEQVIGDARVDRRADVYALGVTLFEGLAGRRPFDEPTRDRLFQQIRYGVVPRLRTLNDKVPADLEIVVACAMERSPERRYRTSLEFAEDLARVLRRDPIQARRPSTTTKALRWAQRNPMVAMMSLALFALVGSLASVFAYESHRRGELLDKLAQANEDLGEQNEQAQTARDLAKRSELDANWQTYLASMRAANLQRQMGDVDGALLTLEQCKPEFRGFEWRHEMLRCDSYLEILHDDVHVAAVDPTGRLLALGRDQGSVDVVDAITQSPLRSIATGKDIATMDFDPKGRFLAIGFVGARPRVFDATTGEIVLEVAEPMLPGHEAVVAAQVAVSEDAQWLAERTHGNSILVWKRDGSRSTAIDGHFRDMEFFDQDSLGAASNRGLQLMQLRDHTTTIADERPCTAIAAIGDGRYMAIAAEDGSVYFSDFVEKKKWNFRAHNGHVHSLVYIPEVGGLISAGVDATIGVHHLDGPRRISFTLSVPQSSTVLGVAADNSRLLVKRGQTVYSYSPFGGGAAWTHFGRACTGVSSLGDGHMLAFGEDGRVEMVDIDTMRTKAVVGRSLFPVRANSTSRDGRLAVTGDEFGTVRIFDVAACKQTQSIDHTETFLDGAGEHAERYRCRVSALAIRDVGSCLAVVYHRGPVVLFDVASGDMLHRLPLSLGGTGVQFVPASQDLIVTTRAGLQVLDSDRFTLGEAWGTTGQVLWAPEISMDGDLLTACGEDGVQLWSLLGKPKLLSKLPCGPAARTAISRTGGRLAVSFRDTPMLQLFDLATLENVYVARDFLLPVTGLQWSPDGTQLFVASGRLDVFESQRASPSTGLARNRETSDFLRATVRTQPIFDHYLILEDVLAALGNLGLGEDERAACESFARASGTNIVLIARRVAQIVCSGEVPAQQAGYALHLANEALRLAPGYPMTRLLVGAAQYRSGHLELAKANLEEVVRVGRFRRHVLGPANLFLAMIAAEQGHRDEAIRLLDQSGRFAWTVWADYSGRLQVEAGKALDSMSGK